MRIPLAAKATLLIFATAAATILIAALTLRDVFSEGQVAQWQRHLVGVVQFAADSIIADPTPENIVAVADRLNVDVRYVGPAGDYSTRANMPGPHALRREERRHPHRFRSRRLPRGMGFFFIDGRHYVLKADGAHRVVFALRGHASVFDELPSALLQSAAALVALFAAIVFLMRWMLRPLRTVASHMEIVGTGAGAKVPRPAGSSDEVTSLVESFNSMSERVAELLAGKERLLRDVSHEVRAPLARLRLRLEYVEDQKLRAKLAADLEEIDRLAGELLERARLQGGQPMSAEPVDACALLIGLRANLTAGQRKSVAVDVPAAPLMVRADPRLLARALGIMLDNSIKYSKRAPGSIVLSAADAADGYRVRLAVSDQGKHLADQTVARMRESFFRPDDSRTRATGGFGLGLAIADAIVRSHGAQLRMSSPESGGLVCEFELPPAAEAG